MKWSLLVAEGSGGKILQGRYARAGSPAPIVRSDVSPKRGYPFGLSADDVWSDETTTKAGFSVVEVETADSVSSREQKVVGGLVRATSAADKRAFDEGAAEARAKNLADDDDSDLRMWVESVCEEASIAYAAVRQRFIDKKKAQAARAL